MSNKNSQKQFFACYKQFLDRFLNTNENCVTLMKKAYPLQMLQKYGNCKPNSISTVHWSITLYLKTFPLMTFARGWLCNVKKEEIVTSVSEISEAYVKVWWKIQNNSRVNIYKIIEICKYTDISLCISISSDLRAQYFPWIFMNATDIMVLRSSK